MLLSVMSIDRQVSTMASRAGLAVSGRFDYHGGAGFGVGASATVGAGGGVSWWSPSVSVTYAPGLSRKTSPYFRTGLGRTHYSSGFTSRFDVHVGLGLRTCVSQSVGLQGEWSIIRQEIPGISAAVWPMTLAVGLSVFP